MAFLDRVIERLGGVSQARLQETVRTFETKVQEAASNAYQQGYYDGNDDPPSGEVKTFGYRRVTSRHLRDFTKMSREKVLETIWTLWQSSPIAKRIIKIKRGYIIGDGVSPETTDETASELVDGFWYENGMAARQKEFTEQLYLFGEQCYPAFVRKADGRTKISYLDPGVISEVIQHPRNSMQAVAVVVDVGDGKKHVYRIIQKDSEYVDGDKVVEAKYPDKLVIWQQANIQPWELDTLKQHEKSQYDGSVFFYKVNAVSNQPRGYSDLLQVADWIDQADATLFALADREQFASYFSFDVTLNGANDEVVKTRSKLIRSNPPAKGSVNVHNDAETWKLETPDLKQQGSIDTFIALMTNIMGGMGMPLAWYGYGNDTNRATLGEQGAPAWKQLRDDQNTLESMFTEMCQFAIDQATIAGKLSDDVWAECEVYFQMPEMTNKDISQIVGILPNYANALVQATQAGWMRQEKAVEAWAKLMGELGVEIDPLEDAGEQEPDPETEPENPAPARVKTEENKLLKLREIISREYDR